MQRTAVWRRSWVGAVAALLERPLDTRCQRGSALPSRYPPRRCAGTGGRLDSVPPVARSASRASTTMRGMGPCVDGSVFGGPTRAASDGRQFRNVHCRRGAGGFGRGRREFPHPQPSVGARSRTGPVCGVIASARGKRPAQDRGIPHLLALDSRRSDVGGVATESSFVDPLLGAPSEDLGALVDVRARARRHGVNGIHARRVAHRGQQGMSRGSA